MQHYPSQARMISVNERRSSPQGSVARSLIHPAAKPFLFFVCLIPLAWFFHLNMSSDMRIELDDAFIHFTGSWSLYFLYLTLCVTPLRQLTGQIALVRFRRTLGLTAFLYALLHFYSYAWLDMGLDPGAIVSDIQKRPAAIMGAVALALLIPVALTASNAAIKRLGVKRWQAIHKAVYLIVVLVVLHMLMIRMGKGELIEVAINAAIVTLLLGWRLVAWLLRQSAGSDLRSDKQNQIAPEVYALLEAIDRRNSGARLDVTNVGHPVSGHAACPTDGAARTDFTSR